MKTLKIISAILILSLGTGCGFTAGGLKNDPGYAAFSYPAFWEADKEVSISLGPTIMGFARTFIQEDEEFAHLIKDVKGLHLRVYNVEDNLEMISNYVDESALLLNQTGWETLVIVHDETEHVAVMVKMDEDEIQGLVVLVAEPTEAVFINVIGNIKPEALQPIIAQVYSDVPEALTIL